MYNRLHLKGADIGETFNAMIKEVNATGGKQALRAYETVSSETEGETFSQGIID